MSGHDDHPQHSWPHHRWPTKPLSRASQEPAWPQRRPPPGARGERLLFALGLVLVSGLLVGFVLVAALLAPRIGAAPALAVPPAATDSSGAPATATIDPNATPTATTMPTATTIPLPPDRIPYLCDPTPTPSTQPCTPCPYDYRPQSSPLDVVKQALNGGADTYQLPRPLVYAIAASESSWRHDNQVSCNFDIGIMQLKKGYWRSIDMMDEPACGLTITQDDPYELQGGAQLGAKLIKWLYCYFTFMNGAGTLANPAANTSAWYYAQAGKTFPDSELCGAHAGDQLYQALGGAASDGWSCPFDARPGSPTILDLVIAAYNSGVGAISQSGGITNQWYVDGAEHWIIHFQNNDYP